MFDLFATVVNGLEDVAASEVEALTGRPASVDVGKIFFSGDVESIFRVNYCSRTINRVVILLLRKSFGSGIGLDDIYSSASALDYASFITEGQSFAVRAKRSGKHNFTSMDVASEVGRAIIDSFRRDTGHRLRVDLENPDVEFLVLVRDGEFIMGINTTGEALHKRRYRVFSHPAALNTTIASAMLMISGWSFEEPLVDPMCGGGTIPIEAALMARGIPPGRFRGGDYAFFKLEFLDLEVFRRVADEALSRISSGVYPIYGLEVNPKYLDGALKNAESAGVGDTITLRVGDAMRLRDHLSFTPRYIVTNPPYGIRMRRGRMDRFYARFLRSLREVAEGSTLTLITAAKRGFLRAVEEVGLDILERRDLLYGDLRASIFKCRVR